MLTLREFGTGELLASSFMAIIGSFTNFGESGKHPSHWGFLENVRFALGQIRMGTIFFGLLKRTLLVAATVSVLAVAAALLFYRI